MVQEANEVFDSFVVKVRDLDIIRFGFVDAIIVEHDTKNLWSPGQLDFVAWDFLAILCDDFEVTQF